MVTCCGRGDEDGTRRGRVATTHAGGGVIREPYAASTGRGMRLGVSNLSRSFGERSRASLHRVEEPARGPSAANAAAAAAAAKEEAAKAAAAHPSHRNGRLGGDRDELPRPTQDSFVTRLRLAGCAGTRAGVRVGEHTAGARGVMVEGRGTAYSKGGRPIVQQSRGVAQDRSTPCH